MGECRTHDKSIIVCFTKLIQMSQPFLLIQHLAHSRWSDVPPAERTPLSNLFLQLLATSGGEGEPWAIKSRAAALVAEVIRQEGPKLLGEVLPPLREMAQQGPAQAETVAMLLRWLPEDVTVHNEDLDGARRLCVQVKLRVVIVLVVCFHLHCDVDGIVLRPFGVGSRFLVHPPF